MISTIHDKSNIFWYSAHIMTILQKNPIASRSAAERGARAALLAIIALLFVSCMPREGWGLVLWAAQDSKVTTGTIVPLYFKSNITRSWIAGIPRSNGKEEIELWRVKRFSSKRKAETEAKAYQEYLSIFAQSKRSGLVMRESPDNLSKQIYRFMENERVKVIKKVKGVDVQTGSQKLEGDWYYVISSDGTMGYIFSNQFTILDTAKALTAGTTERQPVAEPDFLKKAWKPSFYKTLTANGTSDLLMIQPTFGFFYYGSESRIYINLPWLSKSYPVEQIFRNADGSYVGEPSKIRFMITSENELMCIPPTEDTEKIPEDAKYISRTVNNEVAFTFYTANLDIQKLVNTEKSNRILRLKTFLANGHQYTSTTNGKLTMFEGGKFLWENYENLIPSVMPEDMGTSGTIIMDRFLATDLAGTWQGAFSLYFDGKPQTAFSFAYRLEGTNLILLPVLPEEIYFEQILKAEYNDTLEFVLESR